MSKNNMYFILIVITTLFGCFENYTTSTTCKVKSTSKTLVQYIEEAELEGRNYFLSYQDKDSTFKRVLHESYKEDSISLFRFLIKVVQNDYNKDRNLSYKLEYKNKTSKNNPLDYYLMHLLKKPNLNEKIKVDSIIKILARNNEYKYRDLWYNRRLRPIHTEANQTKSLREYAKGKKFLDFRLFLTEQKKDDRLMNSINDAFYYDSLYLKCFVTMVMLSQAVYELENKRGSQSLFMSSPKTSLERIRKSVPISYYILKYIKKSPEDIDIFPSSIVFCILNNKAKYPEVWECDDFFVKTFSEKVSQYSNKGINCKD